ncbi:MAG: hypothetical protein GX781_00575 [Clostridiales bacterium]|nr:hypothetical protein [Clostridiales bacterium]
MKFFRNLLAMVLCIMTLFVLPVQAVISVQDTDSGISAPKGFETLKATKKNIDQALTSIRIPGIEDPVYAYTDKSGATIFLVFGKLNDKKGLFEATLSAEEHDDTRIFALHIFGEKPHKFTSKDLGKPKAVKLNAATLPESYRKTSKPGVCYFTNLFNQKEYRVLGRIEGRPDVFYPASYGKPKAGSLPIDMAKDAERFKLEGAKYITLPKEYKSGYATAVLVLTSQAEWVSLMTDKPELDLAKLK